MTVCGSLELRPTMCGSVRMFYAIISLMLGFGASIGSAIYGAVDRNACRRERVATHSIGDTTFFSSLHSLPDLNQPRPSARRAPDGFHLPCRMCDQPLCRERLRPTAPCELSGGIGGRDRRNICSRFMGGLRFLLMISGIFVQVPSGLTAKGSLLWGIRSANELASKLTEPASP